MSPSATQKVVAGTLLLSLVICATLGRTAPNEVPLVAHYTMDSDPANPKKLTDAGPLSLHGSVGGGATFIEGRKGQALQLSGQGDSAARVS
ncbi:MAG: hypothetical protein M3347_00810, partial [Armatimonadota bacterium]|nr:hypothetical protein [Armatimonadota bacterium]